MTFENGDELDYCVDTQTHGIKIENMRKFLRIYFIEALLEHLRFFEVRLLSSILASGEKNF